MELWLCSWDIGSIWQHIPIDTGVHGLRLQEETRKRSRPNVRSQIRIHLWSLALCVPLFRHSTSSVQNLIRCTG